MWKHRLTGKSHVKLQVQIEDDVLQKQARDENVLFFDNVSRTLLQKHEASFEREVTEDVGEKT